jgi:predicted nucleotidyltransferase
MLKLFNDLQYFFNDVYREVSVREYAKIINVSPPTASKILQNFEKERILISEKKGIYIYYRVNRGSSLFLGFSKLYWQQILIPLTKEIHKKIYYGDIILFGSLIKVENTKKSDVDLYLDIDKKELDVKNIEKKLKRPIELHFKTKNKNLMNNINDGMKIW